MALNELAALESAYHALEPLDEPARQRALQWLSGALSERQALADGEPAAAVGRAEITPATKPATTQRRVAASSAPTITSAPRRGRSAKTSSSGGERPYRRMPDPDEIMAAYEKVGSVGGLARHFNVPKYTAHHWARRMRSQGYNIGRGD